MVLKSPSRNGSSLDVRRREMDSSRRGFDNVGCFAGAMSTSQCSLPPFLPEAPFIEYISFEFDVNILQRLQRTTSFQFAPCFPDNKDGAFQLTGVWSHITLSGEHANADLSTVCFNWSHIVEVSASSSPWTTRSRSVEGPLEKSFRDRGSRSPLASAAGRPSAMREAVTVPRLRRWPRRWQQLDGCRGTRAALRRVAYCSQKWIAAALRWRSDFPWIAGPRVLFQ